MGLMLREIFNVFVLSKVFKQTRPMLRWLVANTPALSGAAKVHAVGVSNVSGSVAVRSDKIFGAEDLTIASSVRKHPTERVPIVRLDDFLTQHAITPYHVSIDTEVNG